MTAAGTSATPGVIWSKDALIGGVERGLQVARHAARNYQNDIESHIAHGIFRMVRKPELSRRDDTVLLPLADCFRSGIEAVAGLHFDENQHTTPARHNIDLAERGAETPRH